MEKITEKILNEFHEQDNNYVRVVREFGTVRNIPGNRELALRYIQQIKEETYNRIKNIVDEEINALETGSKGQSTDDNSTAALLKKSNMIALMQAEINGSEDHELIDLVDEYRSTEYFDLFKTMIGPRLREMRLGDGMQKRAANEIMRRFESAQLPEIKKLKEQLNHIHTIQFFNPGTITLSPCPTEEGIFLLGNGQRRNIAFDLDAATADFNPLEEAQEPLVISESVGKYTVKSIKHLFSWNQEA